MILQDMTQADMIAKIEALEAKLAASKRAQGRLSMKVTEKGGVSVYGLGRFPVTLYGSQWNRLLDSVPQIRAFLEANADSLATKD